MTQEAIQITETPPLPGLKLVQDTNKALETIATDFAGSTDPAALAAPYMTWADTGNALLKRRNAANTAWVTLGGLLDTAASESSAGIAEIATQAETDVGTDDTTIVTPKKLRWGVSMLLAQNGYIVFPSWLGGLILQWGRKGGGAAGVDTGYFPIPFPNACYSVTTNLIGAPPAGQILTSHITSISADRVTISKIFRTDGSSSSGQANQGWSFLAVGK